MQDEGAPSTGSGVKVMTPSRLSFLQTLSTLRWLAIASQAVTVLVVSRLLELPVPYIPTGWGIALLAAFNVYASWRSRRVGEAHPAEACAHILVDVAVLAWLIAWNGGIANPFTPLFLLPIAFAALALPLRWVYVTAAVCGLGYAASVLFGRPLPHVHDGPMSTFDLHLWGMVVNFVISAVLVLYFLSRMAMSIRQRQQELSLLRERFARNEGIVALATHAASVAHELNTPLGTMTLLLDDLIEEEARASHRADLRHIRSIVNVCRDRVRALAMPADAANGHDGLMPLREVISHWQLIRPSIQLAYTGLPLQGGQNVPASVAQLLQVLLNNAADASLAAGRTCVGLHLDLQDARLQGVIRDHGAGFDLDKTLLPGKLHSSDKPGGLGIGLALSHATVERLGGSLTIRAAEGEGAWVEFSLPLQMET